MSCATGRKKGIVRLVTLNCEICNKEFLVYPYEARIRHKVTCSKECRIMKNKIGDNKGRFLVGHPALNHKGYKLSEESKNKMSLSKIGKPSHRKGKKHTEEARKKISLSGKGRVAWNKGMIGIFIKEKSMNWHGGKSFEEYGLEFDSSLKESIRLRDEYKCRECGVSQLESGRQLCVHHIDFDKKNNAMQNLIALCLRCHAKTCATKNRDEYISYYKNKMIQIIP